MFGLLENLASIRYAPAYKGQRGMHLYMDNCARHRGDPQSRREHGLDVDESNQERLWMEAGG